MINSRRAARACQAAALTLFTIACHTTATTGNPWLCLPGFYGAAFAAWCAAHHTADHRAVEARHALARRAAATDNQTLAVPAPCCSFWKHSDGEVHGPDCTRPPAARRDDYRLDPTTAAVFEEITADFDDRSAA